MANTQLIQEINKIKN